MWEMERQRRQLSGVQVGARCVYQSKLVDYTEILGISIIQLCKMASSVHEGHVCYCGKNQDKKKKEDLNVDRLNDSEVSYSLPLTLSCPEENINSTAASLGNLSS